MPNVWKYPIGTITPVGIVKKCQAFNPANSRRDISYRIESPTGIIFWITEKDLDAQSSHGNAIGTEAGAEGEVPKLLGVHTV